MYLANSALSNSSASTSWRLELLIVFVCALSTLVSFCNLVSLPLLARCVGDATLAVVVVKCRTLRVPRRSFSAIVPNVDWCLPPVWPFNCSSWDWDVANVTVSFLLTVVSSVAWLDTDMQRCRYLWWWLGHLFLRQFKTSSWCRCWRTASEAIISDLSGSSIWWLARFVTSVAVRRIEPLPLHFDKAEYVWWFLHSVPIPKWRANVDWNANERNTINTCRQ